MLSAELIFLLIPVRGPSPWALATSDHTLLWQAGRRRRRAIHIGRGDNKKQRKKQPDQIL